MIAQISECMALAKRIKELCEEDIVISISGIGTPSVLLEDTVFHEAFPDCTDGTIHKGYDDKFYRHFAVALDGVVFKCVEEVEDGLGST